ncbi:MAG: hypothetical protein KatS3mg081_1078 [Gemmatimonadales bacterium]|nr:MAG: hypothetical protein KatS3mg081_1078 [Gemmatimonadales bacterium]
MIPRIIHQTWKTERIPEAWLRAQQSWRSKHPQWQYRFWSDYDLDELVRLRFPRFYRFWRSYPEAIQRVDAARYFILYEFGGVYADLDMVCLRPLDDLLIHDLVLARTVPLGLSNQLMMARPGHSFFARAIELLPSAFRRWHRRWIPRHFRILLTTGPLFITGLYRRYGAGTNARLLSLDEHGHGRPERSYVRHLPGNSWAGWDTKVLTYLQGNWRWLAFGALVTAAVLGMAEELQP